MEAGFRASTTTYQTALCFHRRDGDLTIIGYFPLDEICNQCVGCSAPIRC
jgi:hypothetical protein